MPLESSRDELLALVTELIASAANTQIIFASEYLLEPAKAPAIDRATWDLPDTQIELALSRPQFRPPFEWLAEITSRHLKDERPDHFLITEDGVMAAERRELTPLNVTEAASLREQLESLRRV